MLAELFAASDAVVIAAVLGLVTAIVTAFGTASLLAMRRSRVLTEKVHTDNRDDHRETAAKVDKLLTGQTELVEDVQILRADMREGRADIRDLKESDRAAIARIDRLEQGERHEQSA